MLLHFKPQTNNMKRNFPFLSLFIAICFVFVLYLQKAGILKHFFRVLKLSAAFFWRTLSCFISMERRKARRVENRIILCGAISYAVKLLVKSFFRYAPSRQRTSFLVLTSFYFFPHDFQVINFTFAKQRRRLGNRGGWKWDLNLVMSS